MTLKEDPVDESVLAWLVEGPNNTYPDRGQHDLSAEVASPPTRPDLVEFTAMWTSSARQNQAWPGVIDVHPGVTGNTTVAVMQSTHIEQPNMQHPGEPQPVNK